MLKYKGAILLVVVLLCPFISAGALEEVPFSNSQLVEIEEILFHYRQWIPGGEPQGQILFIHGLGGSTFSWRHNVEVFLEAGYRVLAVDLPAFGYSDRKPGLVHSHQNRSRWLWELIAALSFPMESWHLVGHSMGGGTITAMAHDHPHRVSSLTYIAGAVNTTSSSRGRILRCPPFRQIFTFIARVFLLRKGMIERALTSAYGVPPKEEDVEGYLHPLLVEGTVAAWMDMMETASRIPVQGVEELQVPALLIWGEEDSWVSLEAGERLKGQLQQARLVVLENSGHCPQETHPHQVNRYLLDFLQGL